ncbi:MAG TPA: adenylate/guanylate cyclase domain-containing protein [Gaiellales bacterium]|jgi:pimeloyl-ACP methyl ester carboxylesterase
MEHQTRYAQSGDVSIAYQVVGEGPFDLVFVPGTASHVEMAWQVPGLRRLFERLSAFARLVVFDKRGTGMSDSVDPGSPLEVRIDDVRAVMDAAGSRRAALMGVSEGVPMSLLFAATHPQRVAALVCSGGLARTLWAPDYPWGIPEPDYHRMILEERQQAAGPAHYEEMARSGSPNASGEELAALARYMRYAASPGAVEALARMNMGIDVRAILPAIAVPTLVLHHDEDPWCSVEQGRYLAEQIPGAAYRELHGTCHIPSLAEVERVADEVEEFLGASWDAGGWQEPERERVLTTILFTDIVGSTDRLAAIGDAGWQALVERHHSLVRRQLVRFRGRELDTAGDGFFASFDGPARGIRCASAIRDAVGELDIRVRAGLHTGECQVVDGKFAGIAVHIGARVAANAGPGEVLVSGTVRDLVAGSGIRFDDRGVHELKGVPGEWHLFSVAAT